MSAAKPNPGAWWSALEIPQGDQALKICDDLGFAKAPQAIKEALALDRAPSQTAVWKFYQVWPIRRGFLEIHSYRVAREEALRRGDTPTLTEEELARIEMDGQAQFLTKAVKAGDADRFAQFRRLSQYDQSLRLDRKRNEEAVRQKDEALRLQLFQAQREKCELVLKALTDKRAAEIANSDEDYSDRLEKLGQLMFGSDWDLLNESARRPD